MTPFHVILTRFNLPSTGAESYVRARENWLVERVDLFEKYCLPSVEAQTNHKFSWIVYFDPDSPEWLRKRIALHEERGAYVARYRSQVSRVDLIEDISAVTGDRGRRLITTNLDNDDSLAIDFVERVQSACPKEGRAVVYLVNGLVKSRPRVYARRDRSNAFCSAVEGSAEPSTCWADWHTELGKSMSVVALNGRPGWLQVIHGGNVSNRIRGRITSPARYRDIFPGLLDDLHAPRMREFIREFMMSSPRRLVRELMRALVKRAIVSVLGRGGIDRVKVFWASHIRP